MTCPEFRDRIEEYVDGLLPPEESARFNAHRDDCGDCRVELAEADRFRELLDTRGKTALTAWEGQRIAARAAARVAGTPVESPAEGAPVASATVSITALRTRKRWTVVRLATAAAVLVAAGFLGAGLFGESGPQVLAEGIETRLAPGDAAWSGSSKRVLVAEGREAVVEVASGSGGALLRLNSGSVLFRVEPGSDLTVATAAGRAVADGTTLVIDVRGDRSVAVSVIAGKAHFVQGDRKTHLRPGERFEIDAESRPHLLSSANLHELELEAHLQRTELDALREQLSRAEELVRVTSEAANPEASDAIPWEDLGRAMHALIGGATRAERLEALSVFFAHAARIQDLTGASDPLRALAHPRFLDGIAPSFFRALAPEATDSSLDATVLDTRAATDALAGVMNGSPTPTELGAQRQRTFVAVIRSAQRNLGVGAAATMVDDLPKGWMALRPSVRDLDDRTEGQFVAWWSKHFALDEAQKGELAIVVRRYVEETLTVQEAIRRTIPPDEFAAAVFPRSRRWPRNGHVEEEPKGASSDRVAEQLRLMEARLRVAEPRIGFEQALWTLLRQEQRERGFGSMARLHSFRN